MLYLKMPSRKMGSKLQPFRPNLKLYVAVAAVLFLCGDIAPGVQAETSSNSAKGDILKATSNNSGNKPASFDPTSDDGSVSYSFEETESLDPEPIGRLRIPQVVPQQKIGGTEHKMIRFDARRVATAPPKVVLGNRALIGHAPLQLYEEPQTEPPPTAAKKINNDPGNPREHRSVPVSGPSPTKPSENSTQVMFDYYDEDETETKGLLGKKESDKGPRVAKILTTKAPSDSIPVNKFRLGTTAALAKKDVTLATTVGTVPSLHLPLLITRHTFEEAKIPHALPHKHSRIGIVPKLVLGGDEKIGAELLPNLRRDHTRRKRPTKRRNKKKKKHGKGSRISNNGTNHLLSAVSQGGTSSSGSNHNKHDAHESYEYDDHDNEHEDGTTNYHKPTPLTDQVKTKPVTQSTAAPIPIKITTVAKPEVIKPYDHGIPNLPQAGAGSRGLAGADPSNYEYYYDTDKPNSEKSSKAVSSFPVKIKKTLPPKVTPSAPDPKNVPSISGDISISKNDPSIQKQTTTTSVPQILAPVFSAGLLQASKPTPKIVASIPLQSTNLTQPAPSSTHNIIKPNNSSNLLVGKQNSTLRSNQSLDDVEYYDDGPTTKPTSLKPLPVTQLRVNTALLQKLTSVPAPDPAVLSSAVVHQSTYAPKLVPTVLQAISTGKPRKISKGNAALNDSLSDIEYYDDTLSTAQIQLPPINKTNGIYADERPTTSKTTTSTSNPVIPKRNSSLTSNQSVSDIDYYDDITSTKPKLLKQNSYTTNVLNKSIAAPLSAINALRETSISAQLPSLQQEASTLKPRVATIAPVYFSNIVPLAQEASTVQPNVKISTVKNYSSLLPKVAVSSPQPVLTLKPHVSPSAALKGSSSVSYILAPSPQPILIIKKYETSATPIRDLTLAPKVILNSAEQISTQTPRLPRPDVMQVSSQAPNVPLSNQQPVSTMKPNGMPKASASISKMAPSSPLPAAPTKPLEGSTLPRQISSVALNVEPSNPQPAVTKKLPLAITNVPIQISSLAQNVSPSSLNLQPVATAKHEAYTVPVQIYTNFAPHYSAVSSLQPVVTRNPHVLASVSPAISSSAPNHAPSRDQPGATLPPLSDLDLGVQKTQAPTLTSPQPVVIVNSQKDSAASIQGSSVELKLVTPTLQPASTIKLLGSPSAALKGSSSVPYNLALSPQPVLINNKYETSATPIPVLTLAPKVIITSAEPISTQKLRLPQPVAMQVSSRALNAPLSNQQQVTTMKPNEMPKASASTQISSSISKMVPSSPLPAAPAKTIETFTLARLSSIADNVEPSKPQPAVTKTLPMAITSVPIQISSLAQNASPSSRNLQPVGTAKHEAYTAPVQIHTNSAPNNLAVSSPQPAVTGHPHVLDSVSPAISSSAPNHAPSRYQPGATIPPLVALPLHNPDSGVQNHQAPTLTSPQPVVILNPQKYSAAPIQGSSVELKVVSPSLQPVTTFKPHVSPSAALKGLSSKPYTSAHSPHPVQTNKKYDTSDTSIKDLTLAPEVKLNSAEPISTQKPQLPQPDVMQVSRQALNVPLSNQQPVTTMKPNEMPKVSASPSMQISSSISKMAPSSPLPATLAKILDASTLPRQILSVALNVEPSNSQPAVTKTLPLAITNVPIQISSLAQNVSPSSLNLQPVATAKHEAYTAPVQIQTNSAPNKLAVSSLQPVVAENLRGLASVSPATSSSAPNHASSRYQLVATIPPPVALPLANPDLDVQKTQAPTLTNPEPFVIINPQKDSTVPTQGSSVELKIVTPSLQPASTMKLYVSPSAVVEVFGSVTNVPQPSLTAKPGNNPSKALRLTSIAPESTLFITKPAGAGTATQRVEQLINIQKYPHQSFLSTAVPLKVHTLDQIQNGILFPKDISYLSSSKPLSTIQIQQKLKNNRTSHLNQSVNDIEYYDGVAATNSKASQKQTVIISAIDRQTHHHESTQSTASHLNVQTLPAIETSTLLPKVLSSSYNPFSKITSQQKLNNNRTLNLNQSLSDIKYYDETISTKPIPLQEKLISNQPQSSHIDTSTKSALPVQNPTKLPATLEAKLDYYDTERAPPNNLKHHRSLGNNLNDQSEIDFNLLENHLQNISKMNKRQTTRNPDEKNAPSVPNDLLVLHKNLDSATTVRTVTEPNIISSKLASPHSNKENSIPVGHTTSQNMLQSPTNAVTAIPIVASKISKNATPSSYPVPRTSQNGKDNQEMYVVTHSEYSTQKVTQIKSRQSTTNAAMLITSAPVVASLSFKENSTPRTFETATEAKIMPNTRHPHLLGTQQSPAISLFAISSDKPKNVAALLPLASNNANKDNKLSSPANEVSENRSILLTSSPPVGKETPTVATIATQNLPLPSADAHLIHEQNVYIFTPSTAPLIQPKANLPLPSTYISGMENNTITRKLKKKQSGLIQRHLLDPLAPEYYEYSEEIVNFKPVSSVNGNLKVTKSGVISDGFNSQSNNKTGNNALPTQGSKLSAENAISQSSVKVESIVHELAAAGIIKLLDNLEDKAADFQKNMSVIIPATAIPNLSPTSSADSKVLTRQPTPIPINPVLPAPQSTLPLLKPVSLAPPSTVLLLETALLTPLSTIVPTETVLLAPESTISPLKTVPPAAPSVQAPNETFPPAPHFGVAPVEAVPRVSQSAVAPIKTVQLEPQSVVAPIESVPPAPQSVVAQMESVPRAPQSAVAPLGTTSQAPQLAAVPIETVPPALAVAPIKTVSPAPLLAVAPIETFQQAPQSALQTLKTVPLALLSTPAPIEIVPPAPQSTAARIKIVPSAPQSAASQVRNTPQSPQSSQAPNEIDKLEAPQITATPIEIVPQAPQHAVTRKEIVHSKPQQNLPSVNNLNHQTEKTGEVTQIIKRTPQPMLLHNKNSAQQIQYIPPPVQIFPQVQPYIPFPFVNVVPVPPLPALPQIVRNPSPVLQLLNPYSGNQNSPPLFVQEKSNPYMLQFYNSQVQKGIQNLFVFPKSNVVDLRAVSQNAFQQIFNGAYTLWEALMSAVLSRPKPNP